MPEIITNTFEFDSYKVTYGTGSKKVQASITLVSKGKDVVRLIFLEDWAQAPSNMGGGELPRTWFPISSFQDIHTLLRSESPLLFEMTLISGQWSGTMRSKNLEPVGEWSEG